MTLARYNDDSIGTGLQAEPPGTKILARKKFFSIPCKKRSAIATQWW
jgi:hypothetical protein